MLTRVLAATLLLAALCPIGGAVAADPPSQAARPANLGAEDVAAIRNIILAQLEAFRRDDAVGAFSYATPEIRRIFRTPEIFLRMVRQSYPAVYRPQKFAFREIQLIDGKIVQPLAVVGPLSVPETALYVMKRQPDGAWKIGACIMAREPGNDT